MKASRSGALWGLLAILLAAALYLIFIRPGGEEQAIPEPTVTPALTIPLYEDSSLVPVRIELSDRSGQEFAMSRGGSVQMWVIEKPRQALAEQGVAEMAATQLLTVRVINHIEGTAGLAAFGLDDPAYTLKISFSNGSEDILRIGGKTPTNSGYYAIRSEGPILVLNRIDMEPILGLLTYPPYQPTPAGP